VRQPANVLRLRHGRKLATVRISVLLPARNASATVREALESMLAQTLPPDEIVFVDDASTDGTGELVKDPRVKVVKGYGRGLVAALNLGLSGCTGDLIARMDADDVSHPERLRLQVQLIASNPRLGAVGSLVDCPSMPRLETLLNQTISADQCANARFIEAQLVHPSTTFRREALGSGWEDHGWAEDWDLLLRLHEQGWQLAKVPQKLLQWRDSETRLTRTSNAYSSEQMFKLRAHYLARGPLKDRAFAIWGAGPTGKRLARELEAHGLRPVAFYDVDRNKRIARGVPVLTEPPAPGETFLVVAVGAAGAREEIRAALRGFREGEHFLFAA
jgi:glycosyltransferase involved in cell wall biosynthesis